MDELSMNPQSIPAVKRTVRSLSLGDSRSFVSEALKQTTAKRIFELIRDAYGELLSKTIYSESVSNAWGK
jgi:phosphoenolpyruvate-protein kinase (PTS system EI component)